MNNRYVKAIWGAMYDWPSDAQRGEEITAYLIDALNIPDDPIHSLQRIRSAVLGTKGERGELDKTTVATLRAGFGKDEYILSRLTDLRTALYRHAYSEAALRPMFGLSPDDAPMFFRDMRAKYPRMWTKPGNHYQWQAGAIPTLLVEVGGWTHP